MGCSINVKLDYSPAVVFTTFIRAIETFAKQQRVSDGRDRCSKPDHPVGTSGNRRCIQPLQKFSNVLKSFL